MIRNFDNAINVKGFILNKTCSACPEQYDVYKGGTQVGYLRLRHGRFRADVPDCGGATVYSAYPNGDGIFDSDERDHFLGEAIDAISKYLKENPIG